MWLGGYLFSRSAPASGPVASAPASVPVASAPTITDLGGGRWRCVAENLAQGAWALAPHFPAGAAWHAVAAIPGRSPCLPVTGRSRMPDGSTLCVWLASGARHSVVIEIWAEPATSLPALDPPKPPNFNFRISTPASHARRVSANCRFATAGRFANRRFTTAGRFANRRFTTAGRFANRHFANRHFTTAGRFANHRFAYRRFATAGSFADRRFADRSFANRRFATGGRVANRRFATADSFANRRFATADSFATACHFAN